MNANFSLTQYNAIAITPISFEAPKSVSWAIVTSKNAAKAIIEKQIAITHCFCVGEKTKTLLEKATIPVKVACNNAKALAQHIVQHYNNKAFTFFSGNIRREELPNILKENQVDFEEVVVYKTLETNEEIKGIFDAILFFSPSAVRSFFKQNSAKDAQLFCIGNTTATEASNYSKKITIANKPTIENTIVQVVKHFNK